MKWVGIVRDGDGREGKVEKGLGNRWWRSGGGVV